MHVVLPFKFGLGMLFQLILGFINFCNLFQESILHKLKSVQTTQWHKANYSNINKQYKSDHDFFKCLFNNFKLCSRFTDKMNV